MIRLIIPAFVALLVSGPALTAEGRLFNCTVKDVQQLGNDGVLIRNKVTQRDRDWYKTFTFDEMTGILRYGKSFFSRQMEVVQKGSVDNSAIGLYRYKGAGSSRADLFRIKTFKKEMPFLFLDTDTIYTGNCEVM